MAASALQHFLYDWTGCPFIGLWAPVGESLAEHDKLMFYPMLTWWVIMFFAFGRTKNLDAVKWFSAAFTASILALSFMTVFYCTFFLGLAWPQYLPLHIMFEVISVVLSLLIGWHLYEKSKPNLAFLITAAALTVTVIVLMAVFTFYPPDNPVFWIVEY